MGTPGAMKTNTTAELLFFMFAMTMTMSQWCVYKQSVPCLYGATAHVRRDITVPVRRAKGRSTRPRGHRNPCSPQCQCLRCRRNPCDPYQAQRDRWSRRSDFDVGTWLDICACSAAAAWKAASEGTGSADRATQALCTHSAFDSLALCTSHRATLGYPHSTLWARLRAGMPLFTLVPPIVDRRQVFLQKKRGCDVVHPSHYPLHMCV